MLNHFVWGEVVFRNGIEFHRKWQDETLFWDLVEIGE